MNVKNGSHFLSESMYSSSGPEIRIFQDNKVNTMIADSLTAYAARSSTTIVLIMHDKGVLVFYKEGIQLPAPSQFWEMIAISYTFLCFLK